MTRAEYKDLSAQLMCLCIFLMSHIAKCKFSFNQQDK